MTHGDLSPCRKSDTFAVPDLHSSFNLTSSPEEEESLLLRRPVSGFSESVVVSRHDELTQSTLIEVLSLSSLRPSSGGGSIVLTVGPLFDVPRPAEDPLLTDFVG